MAAAKPAAGVPPCVAAPCARCRAGRCRCPGGVPRLPPPHPAHHGRLYDAELVLVGPVTSAFAARGDFHRLLVNTPACGGTFPPLEFPAPGSAMATRGWGRHRPWEVHPG